MKKLALENGLNFFFAEHRTPEYGFRLYDVFAPTRFVSGLVSTDLRIGFIVFNLVFIMLGFSCYAVPVRRALPAVIPLMWFFVVVEILNGIGHPVISIMERAYVPGTATAPVLFIIAVYLSIQIGKTLVFMASNSE